MSTYTRSGDSGETSLADGSRASKASPRVEAYGAIDEANSAIGLARAAVTDPLLGDVLAFTQQRLFNCCAIVATPPGRRTPATPAVTAEDVTYLERVVDTLEETTGPFAGFVLESGCEAAARLQVARATTRRAERALVALAGSEGASAVDPEVRRFVNRLSDALFSSARYVNALTGTAEEPWEPTAGPPAL